MAQYAPEGSEQFRHLAHAGIAVVVESREAVERESGDVILSGAAVYAEIGEILAGTKPAPRGGRTIFKSVGIAVEDLAAARLVYEG